MLLRNYKNILKALSCPSGFNRVVNAHVPSPQPTAGRSYISAITKRNVLEVMQPELWFLSVPLH